MAILSEYNYGVATSRNMGWLTVEEQAYVGRCCVAIAGLGGVGALHALTLAHLGVTNFKIADSDSWELANFNRQFPATTRTLGMPKTHVVKDQILDINPKASVEIFQNLDSKNVINFVSNATVCFDGIDFFALEPRRLFFKVADDWSVPVITAAPLGMGASCMCFHPSLSRYSFEEYFRFGSDHADNLIKFLVGMSPAMPHRKYLSDPTAVDFENRKVPSTVMGCEVAASLAGSAFVRVLRQQLYRGRLFVEGAPLCVHQDAYLGKTWRTERGPRHPLRLLTLAMVRRKLAKK